MLRNLGIRSKILATLSIPVLLLFIVAGALIKDSIDRRLVAKSYASVIETNSSFNQLIHSVQAERSLSMAVLSGDITKKPILDQTRAGISQGLSTIENNYGDGNPNNARLKSPGLVKIWNQMLTFNKSLERIRKQIDNKQLTVNQVNSAYSGAVDELLKIPAGLAQEYPVLSMQRFLNTVTVAEGANEAVMRERDALTPILTVGGYSSAAEQQAARLAIMRRMVTGESARSLSASLNGKLPSSSPLSSIENKLLSLGVGKDPGISVAQLNSAANSESDNLGAFEAQQKSVARNDVNQTIEDATQRLIWTVLGSLLVLASMLLLALYMSRTISAPLRRLTTAVSRVRSRLPQLVSRDNPEQKITLTDDMIVPIEGDDEIGRLARSFNEVNQTVVDTANSQAELRSSIAGMFVNVARRDQTLLSRQLSLIDQLERTEEDPQTLSTLFKLDHLSTRMRRNAEALLVLAGIDTGRRLRRAMALSDVVRTASSEIEHYDRVDLVQTVDPQMLGHTALSAASMLAELLENATAFSDPNSRVSVRTENSPGGIAVIITDEGLGMSEAEVEEANSKISSVSLAEVVASKRIGFFVVGRLARRLEANVVVSRGAGKGTMVRVEFPPQVFVPGAVTHVVAPPAEDITEQAAITSSQPGVGEIAATAPQSATAPSTDATPAAGGIAAAAGASAASRMTRRGGGQHSRTKPDAEERLSRASRSKHLAQPGQETSVAPKAPETAPPAGTTTPVTSGPATGAPEHTAGAPAHPDPLDLAAEPFQPQFQTDALADTAAQPAVSPAPMPRREPAASQEPQERPADTTLPRRSAEPAADSSAAAPDVASPTSTPETSGTTGQRSDAPAARGGLFSSFRRTRDLPESAPTGGSVAPDAGQTSAKPEAPSSRSTAGSTSQGDSKASAEPKAASGSRPEADRGAGAEPAVTGSGARDILPGASARKPQAARGSLFSRMGESAAPAAGTDAKPADGPTQPAAPVAQAPATPAPAAPAPTAPEPAAPAPDAPGPKVSEPAPAPRPAASMPRRTSQTPPVQPLAATSAPGGPGFAAEALSELSRLQAYRPSTMATSPNQTAKPSTLVRRQAGATPAGQLPPPRPQPSGPRRGRSAADVRSMLSGFQAGVERGRNTTDSKPETGEEPTT